MNEQETIADIIAEMRGGPIPQHRHDRVLLRHFADRFEAAYKRERGDCAKLREALASLIKSINDFVDQVDYYGIDSYYRDCYDKDKETLAQEIGKAKAALAAPPRNCDRFGGDIDKLREACARERGLNPEEDFPDVFPGWLLAPSTEKEGGNDGNE